MGVIITILRFCVDDERRSFLNWKNSLPLTSYAIIRVDRVGVREVNYVCSDKSKETTV